MRVIAGLARGSKLIAPEGLHTRPTADRIKEALFNILMPDINGAIFLDLFSGTGAIGIEALSRGAEHVVFIDESKESIDVIRQNLIHTKLIDKSQVVHSSFSNSIDRLGNENIQFDIIFMDPPYGKNYVSEAISKIIQLNILKKDGYIVVEQGVEEQLPKTDSFEYVQGCQPLEIFKIKKYKTAILVFLKYLEE